MSQLTADISRKYKVDNQDVRVDQAVDAAVTIFAGSMVGLNPATSYSRQLVAGDLFVGFADAQAANVANPNYPGLISNGVALGAAGSLRADCRASGILVTALANVAGATGAGNVNQEVCASDGNTLTLPTNQGTITITGSPTGGTYTISVTANNATTTTAAIAYNALASAVQTALQALTNVGAGGVTVTGSAGGPYTANWVGFLPTLAIGTNSLTGGTTPSVSFGTIAVTATLSKVGTIQNFLASTGNLEIFFQSAVRRVA